MTWQIPARNDTERCCPSPQCDLFQTASEPPLGSGSIVEDISVGLCCIKDRSRNDLERVANICDACVCDSSSSKFGHAMALSSAIATTTSTAASTTVSRMVHAAVTRTARSPPRGRARADTAAARSPVASAQCSSRPARRRARIAPSPARARALPSDFVCMCVLTGRGPSATSRQSARGAAPGSQWPRQRRGMGRPRRWRVRSMAWPASRIFHWRPYRSAATAPARRSAACDGRSRLEPDMGARRIVVAFASLRSSPRRRTAFSFRQAAPCRPAGLRPGPGLAAADGPQSCDLAGSRAAVRPGGRTHDGGVRGSVDAWVGRTLHRSVGRTVGRTAGRSAGRKRSVGLTVGRSGGRTPVG